MPLNTAEKAGMKELLFENVENHHILMQLARNVTKNVCDVTSTEEAYEYLCTHIPDVTTLLNKRCITKEVLFKYLTIKAVAIENFTKGTLIFKVISYWNRQSSPQTAKVPSMDAEQSIQSYPINIMAKQFSEWFFKNYNDNKLKLEQFWPDARLFLKVAANDRTDVYECSCADSTLKLLQNTKLQFEFFFNPNLAYEGTQGRMDMHGLVLVLVCGTLHTVQNSVGVFEFNFGLLQDPFAENQWKIKTMKCILRSQHEPIMPNLSESNSLQELLSLPVPTGELI